MTRTSAIRGLRETALWVGAVLGLLAVAAGLAVSLLGCSFLVFRSGSMSPAIETGALALARPTDASDLRVGDVISVRASDGARITHRVVETTLRGDEASLVLRGDANGVPDAEVYTVSSAERVVVSVPYLGYVVAYALTPPGMVAVGAVCLMLLVASRSDGPPAPRPVGRGRGRHRSGRRTRTSVAAVAVGTAVAASAVTGTMAAFTDAATATSGAFAATNVTPPTGVACVGSGNQDYISWSPPTGYPATGYRVFVNGSATAAADLPAGTTQWRPATTFFPQSYANVRIVALRGTWTSSPSATSDSISTLFFFQGTSC